MRMICTMVMLGWIACSPHTTLLKWSQVEGLDQVRGYTYTLRIDDGVGVVIHPTCAGTRVSCEFPLKVPRGKHRVVLTASNAYGEASTVAEVVGN